LENTNKDEISKISGSNENCNDKELADAILLAEKDPVFFIEAFLHVYPYPYQKDFLRDRSKRMVICAGRRVGKSSMIAARGLWFALMHADTTTLIISATLRQSILMFDTILDYISKNSWIENCVQRKTRTLVRFKNGSKIKALPCGRGKGIRGDTADMVILDEASFMPDDVITEAILPMLATTDGTAIMLSSPFDKDHVFYRAFTSTNWSKYHYPTSINPTVKAEFLQEQKELIGEIRYMQEYEAEFVDDASAYFPQSLIRQCVHSCESANKCEYCSLCSRFEALANYASQGIRSDSLGFYGGYDPGGQQDPAAFVLLEKMKDGTLRVVFVKTYLAELHGKKAENDNNLYTRFTAEISDYNLKLNSKMRKLFVDQTGLGQPIIEQCKSLKLPAEGLPLSVKSKEEILANLRILFEQKKIILPSADRDLSLSILSNLNCIEFERKAAGGYAFSHRAGTHDDIAYALALAVWGATTAKPQPTIVINQY
jgi:phage FluMu gp28-like protein